MFEVSVEEVFPAGHSLRNYHGKCENVHGHNYRVRVTVNGPDVDENGLLVDFAVVKKLVRAVKDRLDHQFLNDLEPFDKINPSAENIAKYFYDEIAGGLQVSNGARVSEVKVWETDITYASYRPTLN
jgi:6-pyruvoyltetrahydropterin/6-carboxytetrahydropterin synthase